MYEYGVGDGGHGVWSRREVRRFLEQNRQAYLLAVPANQSLFDGTHRSTVPAIALAIVAGVSAAPREGG